MRTSILLLLVVVFFMSCEKQEKRYTQQSPEIETYKKVVDNYKKLNWEAMATHYADTAKIANNVIKEKAISISKNIEENKKDAEMFTWVVEKEEYEMVVTDENETWVNFWGLWKGTMKTTKKVYDIPYHVTARLINGKIVEEFGYWNNAEITSDLMKAEQKLVEIAESEANMAE
ncbi:MAG: nuclear transport factor 2 family protein [Psychroserpens sp.]|uniref:nuclear transport factor 2 family protein n=1 Tax=Psychroserpens sp. TaxID=2020870 RepID=UPI003C7675DA